MTLRFGTDGVRGLAGADLTPELALALGRVAAGVLGTRRGAGSFEAGRFVVGRDTRRSGPMLLAAFTAGLAAAGADVLDVGVMPTPGVASLASSYHAPGAVISASHNPFADNGIKLFGAGGLKLDDAVEAEIERRLDLVVGTAFAGSAPSGAVGSVPAGATPIVGAPIVGGSVGTVSYDAGAVAWYRSRLTAHLAGRRLEGVRVVLDCGNGAASVVAAEVFDAAGADVVEALSITPDGININDRCGSTDTTALARSVVTHGADIGLAFDGDADRIIAIDGHGRTVDGDRLLALFATDLRRRGLLAQDTVVVTVMTNLGFHRAMAAERISVHATPVGDRHVLAALDANDWSLGGEQSGHLVFRDLATTGDGVLSGLLLVDLVKRAGLPLADLAGAVMERFPQILRNVAVAGRDELGTAAGVWAEVAAVEAELGSSGRVLLRPSGTEHLIRVMVEASTEESAASAADRLVSAVRCALG
jgi:phosphoglucosamine mutase